MQLYRNVFIQHNGIVYADGSYNTRIQLGVWTEDDHYIYMLLKLRLERDHYLSQVNIRWVAKCSRDDRLSWEYAILFYNVAVSLQFIFSFVYKINISCTQLVSSCFVQDQKMILCYCVLKILTFKPNCDADEAFFILCSQAFSSKRNKKVLLIEMWMRNYHPWTNQNM